MRCRSLLWLCLPAAMLLAGPATGAAAVYDKEAAATRARYTENAKKCRKLAPAARAACLELERVGAHAALNRTYDEALVDANAAYARTTARCKTLPGPERRRCLRAARGERSTAIGKAEEIRSAPLAMDSNR